MKTVITITGPSCSGKSTLAKHLTHRGIPEVISFTTRAPRIGEGTQGQGRAYDFWSREAVEAIDPKDLIELIEFKGNLYGNTVQQLEEAFQTSDVVVVVVEPNGVTHWRAAAERLGTFKVHAIYLQQSIGLLIERFTERLKGLDGVSKFDYEIERLQNLVHVEHPNWPKAVPYDLVIENLDATQWSVNNMKGVEGYIRYAFGSK